MRLDNFNIQGLTDEQIKITREKFGKNNLNYKQENSVLDALKKLAREPMIILFLVASVIYFVSGQLGDGIFLASAVIIVSVISLYQDSRSRSALQELKTLSQPNSKVIRNGAFEEIKSEDLVLGDSLVVEEGTSIAADGIIVHSNDFSVTNLFLQENPYQSLKTKKRKTTSFIPVQPLPVDWLL